MSDTENSELDDRFLELNNWQIEQQKKLKKFQEAQRKLLDAEHEKVLSGFKTQNYDQRHRDNEKDTSLYFGFPETEYGLDIHKKCSNPNYLLNFNADDIKLRDPKGTLCSISQDIKPDVLEINNEEDDSSEVNKPRKFLKRGDGLARFRMTLDDFKTPPNIYKEKRIKTYLHQKPVSNGRKLQGKTIKSYKEPAKKKKSIGLSNKQGVVPVNIYVTENKNSGPFTSCDPKVPKCQPCTKNKGIIISKTPVRNLALKPVMPSYCSKKSGEQFSNTGGVTEAENEKETLIYSDKSTIEKQFKKDERELRMFEMLEGRIDDGTLSPNSSLIARFMEDSLCSTPSKPLNGDEEKEVACSYIESLRSLQRQYLTLEQIERIQDCDIELLSEVSHNEGRNEVHKKTSESLAENLSDVDENENEEHKRFEADSCKDGIKDESQQSEKDFCQETTSETKTELTPLLPQSCTTNKTLLQEYIENFKRLNNEMKQNCRVDESQNVEESVGEENSVETLNDQVFNQREIAVKLQRKALQDNVKNLLNWEGSQRKKPVKKFTKKMKVKCTKVDKPKKVEKNEEEKIIFKSGLLKDRLEELEKEIEIFKKENKTLIQLQKDCDTLKSRLEKERKEFEKYMEQEREKFEARMNEEQKKLQRDKSVFEKYCKQIKNQPNRKEREEIANLKKEIEKLTESVVTKDARWGASQARLRNQIKSLERENLELKSEVEKLKKQTAKKVTFDSGRNINTKIIHTINSELGKLKPFLVKNDLAKPKSQCQTARVDTNLPKKPIRRIKSVPDLKKYLGRAPSQEADEKGPVSKSENNMPKVIHSRRDMNRSNIVYHNGNSSSDLSEKLSYSNPEFKTNANSESTDGKKSKDCNANVEELDNLLSSEGIINTDNNYYAKNSLENAVHETFFGKSDNCQDLKTSETISEIKRRLENLNLLHSSEHLNGECDNNKDGSIGNHDVESSGEEQCCSEDDAEFDDSGTTTCTDYEKIDKNFSTTLFRQPFQTKMDSSGIKEKIFDDGRREIIYPNGNIKKISSDARIIKMIYYNGDLKETDIVEGSEKYFYAETKTWHTTYKDGLEVLEFPNGQTERRHPDGSTEILFPNGCVRYCDNSGRDEWRFVDGTVIKTDKNGHKVLLLPNGQKEIHTEEYKKREYPDGTIKFLYADGTQETRYASGRVRLKDKDGNLLMDSGGIR